jgi:hypothetical protein
MDTTPRALSRPDVAARVAAASTRASLDGARAKESRQVPAPSCLILFTAITYVPTTAIRTVITCSSIYGRWGAQDLSQRP